MVLTRRWSTWGKKKEKESINLKCLVGSWIEHIQMNENAGSIIYVTVCKASWVNHACPLQELHAVKKFLFLAAASTCVLVLWGYEVAHTVPVEGAAAQLTGDPPVVMVGWDLSTISHHLTTRLCSAQKLKSSWAYTYMHEMTYEYSKLLVCCVCTCMVMHCDICIHTHTHAHTHAHTHTHTHTHTHRSIHIHMHIHIICIHMHIHMHVPAHVMHH